MEQLNCYCSVFESINKNCTALHGTIDEICNSSAVSSTVIDIEDSLIELIDMTDRFMKEIDHKDLSSSAVILQKKCEVAVELVSLLIEILTKTISIHYKEA